MSGETSCFYRLFVARLQVFPLFFPRGLSKERCERRARPSVTEVEFSLIASEQEVQSDTSLLGLQGTAPVNRLFFEIISDRQW